MADVPLFELRGISKEFPGVKALDDVSFEIRAGEVHMLRRRERRRQIDPDEDSVRRLSRRSRRILQQGRSGDDSRRGRGAPIRHRRHLPGILARPLSRHRAEHLSRPRVRRAACPASSTGAASYAEAKRVLDAIGFDIDPRDAGAQSRRRPAADGRDRQGAVAERAHPGDGRADRGAVRPRDRTAVRA